MRSQVTRQCGAVDVLDLTVGILLAIGIPLLTHVGWTLRKPPPLPEAEQEVSPPPVDREEVDMRSQYIGEELYRGNAVLFLVRARGAEGTQQVNELRWARQAFGRVDAELGELQYLINSTGAAVTFREELNGVATIKKDVKLKVAELQRLDHLGILGQ